MKIDKNSSGYIFGYTALLILVVAVLLTAAALWLQPYQQRNKDNEQRSMILAAAGATSQGTITFLDGEMPVYLVNDTVVVIPMTGKGLWGPIWGYLAVTPDGSTIIGANFDHKSETPGLGGEITKEKFQRQFGGKPFMSRGRAVPLEVDAIAGATKTSNGVKEMIEKTRTTYLPYFESCQR